MRRFVVFSVAIFLSGVLFVACERDRGVQAANESETYHPRPAGSYDRKPKVESTKKELKGELVKVDPSGKTISVRLESGMIQTFRFDDGTTVEGLPNEPLTKPTTKTGQPSVITIRNLAGKEGSEVTIKWDEADTPKLATNVEVTQLSNAKNTRHSRR
jgi:hypothetical protein